MLSLIVEDSKNLLPLQELPHFTCFIKNKTITGTPFALGLNGWILDIISGRKENTTGYPIHNEQDWEFYARKFLNDHFGETSKIPLGGKNVATFDMLFLPKDIHARFDYKVIDPAMLFVDWNNDTRLPGLDECKKRAGLEPIVAHDSRQDALDVIQLLRTKYN